MIKEVNITVLCQIFHLSQIIKGGFLPMYNNIATKVLTGEVRLSYAYLVNPRANSMNPSEEPKFSVTLLIPKTDLALKQNIDASIEAAALEAQSKSWGGVRPPKMPTPIHDGDGLRDNGTPYGEECRGCWVITASSKLKPQVVHQSDIHTELLPQDIYSGMYGRVTMNFYGYNGGGKKGVGCGLGNVMKTREGDPLSGGASAASDFAEFASAQAIPPQNYAVPPQQQAIPPQNYAVPPQQQAIPPQNYAVPPQSYQAPPQTDGNPPWAPQTGAINPLTGQPM
ncbi:MAG: DUF2815 family protein [Rikenellaceae bacterium]